MEKNKSNKMSKSVDITYPAPYLVSLAKSAAGRSMKRKPSPLKASKRSHRRTDKAEQHKMNNMRAGNTNFVMKNIKHSKALSDRNKLWKNMTASSCRSCPSYPQASDNLKYGVFPKKKTCNRITRPIELKSHNYAMSNMHRFAKTGNATLKETQILYPTLAPEPPILTIKKPQTADTRTLTPSSMMHMDIKPKRDLRAPRNHTDSLVFGQLLVHY